MRSEPEVVALASALLDLIYDPSHKHLHLVEGGDGDMGPEAGLAAQRLAEAIGYVPPTRR